jgi:hypothetical protein
LNDAAQKEEKVAAIAYAIANDDDGDNWPLDPTSGLKD